MKTILHKIGKHLWVYLVWILAVAVFWSWLFGVLTRVPTEEKLCIFIGTRSAAFDQYEELNAECPAYIRELNVNCYPVNRSDFSGLMEVFGLGEADILIVPESKLSAESYPVLFAGIPPEYLETLPHLGVLEKDGNVYGLLIHDKETQNSLISCLDYGQGDTEENYYLLFNRKSLHLGKMLPSNAFPERNGAIEIAKRLLAL